MKAEVTHTEKSLDNDFFCRKEPPILRSRYQSFQTQAFTNFQNVAPSTLTHLGGYLSHISFSLMATTKLSSSLLMFGLISS